jgi:hypothetical protein
MSEPNVSRLLDFKIYRKSIAYSLWIFILFDFHLSGLKKQISVMS